MFPREATLIYDVELRTAAAEQSLIRLVARFKTLEERIAALRTVMVKISYQFDKPMQAAFIDTIRLVEKNGFLFRSQRDALLTALADFYEAIAKGVIKNEVLEQMLEINLEEAARASEQSMRTVADAAQREFPRASEAAERVGGSLERAGKKSTSLIASLSRFSAFVGVGFILSNAFFTIANNIQEAIKRANEFYDAIFRLNNAARALQSEGIAVTGRDLLSFVGKLREDLGILAKEIPRVELVKLISGVVSLTAGLGLTKDQLYELVRSILILNKVSIESEPVFTTMSKVITSIVSPTGRGAATLGISLGRDILAKLALSKQIIKTVEEYDKLPNEIKVQLRFEALTQQAELKMKDFAELEQLPSSRFAAVKARFADIFIDIGAMFMAGLDHVIPALDTITTALESFVNLMRLFGTGVAFVNGLLSRLVQGILSISAGVNLLFYRYTAGIDVIKQGLKDIVTLFSAGKEEARRYWRAAMPESMASDELNTTAQGFSNLARSVDELGESASRTDVQKNLSSLIKGVMDLYAKMKERTQDFMKDMAREQEDLAISLRRLDVDYANRRASILAESQRKEQDAVQKFNDWLINEEAEKNERLRQLRERFFMDLEDAIRARDATQIIRLTKQYIFERQNIINEFNLRVAERRRALQRELEEERAAREQRLAEEAQEYALRRQRMIEDANLRMQRMQEDYQREMAALREQIREKIMEVANGIAQELGLRDAGMRMIYQTLLRYLGPGGMLDSLYQYSTQSAINAANTILSQIQRIIAALSGANLSLGGSADIGGQARGGVYFANRPTKAVFGEAGPELAIFLPLGQVSKAAGNVPRSSSVALGGAARIEIGLSDDLVGRITDSALEHIALDLRKIRRMGRP